MQKDITQRKCCICKNVMPVEAFRIKYGNYRESRCNDCLNAYMRGRYDYRRERDKQLRQNYGITLAEYELLLVSQNGVCASCGDVEMGRPGRKKRTEDLIPMLHVDHDHLTGEIRGLLCSGCNLALGSLHDDHNRIKALLKYIEGRTL